MIRGRATIKHYRNLTWKNVHHFTVIKFLFYYLVNFQSNRVVIDGVARALRTDDHARLGSLTSLLSTKVTDCVDGVKWTTRRRNTFCWNRRPCRVGIAPHWAIQGKNRRIFKETHRSHQGVHAQNVSNTQDNLLRCITPCDPELMDVRMDSEYTVVMDPLRISTSKT